MNSDSCRVLLVDDDPEQAEMVEKYLHLSGLFEVDRAASISELWKRLAAGPYDLILLDYRLPDGTGLDALDELNARQIAVPVVMVTGQGDERVVVQAIQRGAADYLRKSGDYMITLPTMIRKTVRANQLQLSMQRSLEQVRYQATLLNNVRDAVVVWDLNGCITYWSAAAAVLFGWGPDERLGRPVAEVYLPAFAPPIVVPKAGDTIGQHVARQYQTRNMQTIWVSSRVSALRDPVEGNRLIGYMDVSHDITKLKETEQALRTERNFVSAVLDTVGALVVVLDRQGRIVRMNRACEQTSGYSFAEVRGKSAWDFLLLPEEAEEIKSIFLDVHPGCFPNEHEHRLFTRLGECRVVAWSNTAITNREGQIEYVIATGLDITRRKQMEAEIRAAQLQLAEAVRLATIGEMASGIAHQINNPLTTIIADAQILLRNLPPGTPGRDSAEAIEQAGWRMQTAVQRLQVFSQPAAAPREAAIINTSL